MPAVSQAQRGYLAMKFGPDWMKKHHFDNKGKLPKHKKSRSGKSKTSFSQRMSKQAKH